MYKVITKLTAKEQQQNYFLFLYIPYKIKRTEEQFSQIAVIKSHKIYNIFI